MNTKYISENDRTCNCGCNHAVYDYYLDTIIDKLTEYIQKNHAPKAYPIFHCITRCLKYNRLLGSKDTSKHIGGSAADLHYTRMDIQKLHKIVDGVHYKDNIVDGGVGWYSWGVHLDTGRLRTWGKKLNGRRTCRYL